LLKIQSCQNNFLYFNNEGGAGAFILLFLLIFSQIYFYNISLNILKISC